MKELIQHVAMLLFFVAATYALMNLPIGFDELSVFMLTSGFAGIFVSIGAVVESIVKLSKNNK